HNHCKGAYGKDRRSHPLPRQPARRDRQRGALPHARRGRGPIDERSHAGLLRLITDHPRAGIEGWALARLEGCQRKISGNTLHAAVLGANDGLVSNLSLIMEVAGAELSAQSILTTGLAGLLA